MWSFPFLLFSFIFSLPYSRPQAMEGFEFESNLTCDAILTCDGRRPVRRRETVFERFGAWCWCGVLGGVGGGVCHTVRMSRSSCYQHADTQKHKSARASAHRLSDGDVRGQHCRSAEPLVMCAALVHISMEPRLDNHRLQRYLFGGHRCPFWLFW